MRSRAVTLPVAASLMAAAFPSPSAACLACMREIADYAVPGVNLWSAWAVAWLAAMSVVRHRYSVALPLVPTGQAWLLLAFGLFGCAAMMYGPPPLAPLALGPLLSFLGALLPGAESRWGVARRRVLQVGGLGVVLGLVLVAYSATVKARRTDVAFLQEWGGGPVARSIFKRLVAKEPESLPVYRELVRGKPGTFAVEAAARLGQAGDPAIDRPLLQDALRRFDADPRVAGWTSQRETLVAALELIDQEPRDANATYICKHPHSDTAKHMLGYLAVAAPSRSLPVYREILQQCPEYPVWEVARRVGSVGEPDIDIPILEATMVRLGMSASGGSGTALRQAIHALRAKRDRVAVPPARVP